jgi:4-hydroxybenzoate polyprenyltransferase
VDAASIVIFVALSLLTLLMLGLGVWALWDTYRSKPDLPLLFRWAQGPNQVMGTVFGLAMIGGGLAIGVVVLSNL